MLGLLSAGLLYWLSNNLNLIRSSELAQTSDNTAGEREAHECRSQGTVASDHCSLCFRKQHLHYHSIDCSLSLASLIVMHGLPGLALVPELAYSQGHSTEAPVAQRRVLVFLHSTPFCEIFAALEHSASTNWRCQQENSVPLRTKLLRVVLNALLFDDTAM